MPIKKGDTYLQVRVSGEFADAIREAAQRRGHSLNQVITEALERELADGTALDEPTTVIRALERAIEIVKAHSNGEEG